MARFFIVLLSVFSLSFSAWAKKPDASEPAHNQEIGKEKGPSTISQATEALGEVYPDSLKYSQQSPNDTPYTRKAQSPGSQTPSKGATENSDN